MLFSTYEPFSRHRDPFSLMRSMGRDSEPSGIRASGTRQYPAFNVWEGDEALALTAELPGVDSSDIDITVSGKLLTLTGERKMPEFPDALTWHRREIGYGTFSRTIQLPFQVDESRVQARLESGVLRIAVGRPEQTKPRKIQVKAEAEENQS